VVFLIVHGGSYLTVQCCIPNSAWSFFSNNADCCNFVFLIVHGGSFLSVQSVAFLIVHGVSLLTVQSVVFLIVHGGSLQSAIFLTVQRV
jgi:hypothetical protein